MDRNAFVRLIVPELTVSLSARRAWIEMRFVAFSIAQKVSLSARRAWIEIKRSYVQVRQALVALRKESVDRNM